MTGNRILADFDERWPQTAGTLPEAAAVWLPYLDTIVWATDDELDAARTKLTTLAAETADRAEACRYDTLTWEEWPGVDGPVLVCDTHGLPGYGEVYQGDPAHPVGVCQAYNLPHIRQPLPLLRA